MMGFTSKSKDGSVDADQLAPPATKPDLDRHITQATVIQGEDSRIVTPHDREKVDLNSTGQRLP